MYDIRMMDTPKSIPDLISKWETIGDFASAIGCGYEAARQMRKRGSIAPEHWSSVVTAARTRKVPGITIEWLATQRTPDRVSA